MVPRPPTDAQAAALASARPLLVIGGIDPGGQAGLTADLHTAWAHGLDARVVVAARTAQTDHTWRAGWPTAADELRTTLDAAAGNGALCAIKTGMLGSTANATVVRDWTASLGEVPLVVDPLAYSSSGGWMWPSASPDEVRAILHTGWMARATIATPNWLELAWWMGEQPATDLDALRRQAAMWPCPLLIKGGHAPPPWQGRDWLWDGEALEALPVRPAWPAGRELRGTGCRLATALAIALGRAPGSAQPRGQVRHVLGSPRALARQDLVGACTSAVNWLDAWARDVLARSGA